MWILVLLWVGSSGMATSSVPNFESKEACNKAYNTLKADVTWGSNNNLTGMCVSAR